MIMKKTYCISTLNDILNLISNHDCFHQIKEELGLGDEELEIILSSEITDIDNDDLE